MTSTKDTMLFNSYNTRGMGVLICPLYRWVHWRLIRMNDLYNKDGVRDSKLWFIFKSNPPKSMIFPVCDTFFFFGTNGLQCKI